MVKETDKNIDTEKVDPEIEYLKKKSEQGAMNVFGDILNNPEIKKIILQKSMIPIITVACLFVGVIELYDVAKQLIGVNWQVQAIIGLVLLAISLSCILKNIFTVKKNAI